MTAPMALARPTPNSIWEMDRSHALHPWTNFGPFEREGSLVISGARAVIFGTRRGGGIWMPWAACGAPMWAWAARTWRRRLPIRSERLAFSNSFVDVTNEPSARLSAKLAALAPGDLNRVHLTTGGSTAVDTAVRMVWY